jgi:hypothetical protein
MSGSSWEETWKGQDKKHMQKHRGGVPGEPWGQGKAASIPEKRQSQATVYLAPSGHSVRGVFFSHRAGS